MAEIDRPDLLAGYPSIVRMPIHWGDQDAFGHVNNTIFLRWFEDGRIAYLTRIGMGSRDPRGPDRADRRGDYLFVSEASDLSRHGDDRHQGRAGGQ